jgi:hypothetical protein
VAGQNELGFGLQTRSASSLVDCIFQVSRICVRLTTRPMRPGSSWHKHLNRGLIAHSQQGALTAEWTPMLFRVAFNLTEHPPAEPTIQTWRTNSGGSECRDR